MPFKLSKSLRRKRGESETAPTVREYEERFRRFDRAGAKEEGSRSREFNNLYQD